MTHQELLSVLPHRPPFLLVDQLVSVEGGRAVGIRNISITDPVFQGHFPDYPLYPGVLIVEALAQVGAAAMLSMPEYQGRIGLLAGLEDVRFRGPVRPGDQMKLVVDILKVKAGIGKGHGMAYVGEKMVAEATILFALRNKEDVMP